MSSIATCRACGGALPGVKTHYCSKRCRQRAARQRRWASARERRTEAWKRRQRRRQSQPFQKFTKATTKRWQVGPGKRDQELARRAIAAGAVAYVNAEGRVADIGKPKKPEFAGQVFVKRPAVSDTGAEQRSSDATSRWGEAR